jgi:hypothetical protein
VQFHQGCHRSARVALHVADEYRAAALRAIAGAFCIRGFVMAAVGYLKIHPKATRHERPPGASGIEILSAPFCNEESTAGPVSCQGRASSVQDRDFPGHSLGRGAEFLGVLAFREDAGQRGLSALGAEPVGGDIGFEDANRFVEALKASL